MKRNFIVILLIVAGSFLLFLYFASQISVSNLISPLRYDSTFLINQQRAFQKGLPKDCVFIQREIYFNPSHVKLNYTIFNVVNNHDTLSGWYIKKQKEKSTTTVLILHDINESKISYLNYARTLYDLGFHVCLIDLPAHGQSTGEKFLLNSTEMLSAVMDSLFCFYETENVAVLAAGISTLLVANTLKTDTRFSVIVFQNPINKLVDALQMHTEEHWNAFSKFIFPLAKYRYKRETGISIDLLNLAELIKKTNKPILISITDSATEIQAKDALAVYDSCQSALKKIWTSKSRAYVTNMFDVENNYFRAVSAFINSSIPKEKNRNRNRRKIALL